MQFLISSPFFDTPDRQLLDSAPNHGPLISLWEINKFELLIQKCQDFRGTKAFFSNFWIC